MGLQDRRHQVNLPVEKLIPGASIICTGTYTVLASDIGPGKTVNNEACVSTNNFENGDLEPGSIRFEQPPLLEDCADRIVDAVVVDLTKTASPLTLPEPGGVFTYTLVIDNDSAVPVVITSLTDSNSALSPDFAAKCGILVGTDTRRRRPSRAGRSRREDLLLHRQPHHRRRLREHRGGEGEDGGRQWPRGHR